MSIFTRLFKIHPDFYTEPIEQKATYANIESYEKLVINIGLMSLALMGLILYFTPLPRIAQIAVFGIFSIPMYLLVPIAVLSSIADKRKTEMERMLPDALLLVSTNLKSGSRINRAFLAGARDEFGPLKYEFTKTAVQISGGVPVDEALDNMRERINSPLFEDTLKILTNAITAGGNTAELLESSADDIRSSLELRDEVRSSVKMYTVFIFIAGVVAAPALFGITSYMAEQTTSMWDGVDLGGGASSFASGGGGGMSFQKPDVNVEFLSKFSILALTISNFFSSLLISEISNGNMRGGAKLIPVTVGISVGLYLLINSALAGVM